jgi:hypothetical protein
MTVAVHWHRKAVESGAEDVRKKAQWKTDGEMRCARGEMKREVSDSDQVRPSLKEKVKDG